MFKRFRVMNLRASESVIKYTSSCQIDNFTLYGKDERNCIRHFIPIRYFTNNICEWALKPCWQIFGGKSKSWDRHRAHFQEDGPQNSQIRVKRTLCGHKLRVQKMNLLYSQPHRMSDSDVDHSHPMVKYLNNPIMRG